MKLLLDTSVLLAASGPGNGASRFLIKAASLHGWELVSSDYCNEETRRNLPKVARAAATAWETEVVPRLGFVHASMVLDKPLVFSKTKDRAVVITALAVRADWLLTLDEGDFHIKRGREVYGLRIATPGEFLIEQRAHGVI